MLFPMINILYVYISTFRDICAVPSLAAFCSSLLSRSPGKLLRYFLNDFEVYYNFYHHHHHPFPLPHSSFSPFSQQYRSHWPSTSYTLLYQKLCDYTAYTATLCIRIYRAGRILSSFELPCNLSGILRSVGSTSGIIQGVPGGKDLTSGECSLGQTIPI